MTSHEKEHTFHRTLISNDTNSEQHKKAYIRFLIYIHWCKCSPLWYKSRDPNSNNQGPCFSI